MTYIEFADAVEKDDEQKDERGRSCKLIYGNEK